MLSRVSAFADVSEEIKLEQLFEYAWPEEVSLDSKNGPTYYVIQELLADYLKVWTILCIFYNLFRLSPSNVVILSYSVGSVMLMSVTGCKKPV